MKAIHNETQIFALVVLLGGPLVAYYLLIGLPKTAPEAHHFTVSVNGPFGLHFSGSVNVDGQGATVSGTVPASYEYTGLALGVVLQKQEDSARQLEVKVQRDIEGVADQATTAPYGVMSVSAR